MVFELVKNIDHERFETIVLCYEKKRNTVIEKGMEGVVKVIYLNQQGKVTLWSSIKIIRALNELKPDIVHAHLGGVNYAILWGMLSKKPLILTMHTTPEKGMSKKVRGFFKWEIAHKEKMSVVAVSKENCEKYQSIFLHEELNKFRYINNGIETKKFYRKKHTEQITFINVASHDENKNQSLLIKCFYKLLQVSDNICLILVGDGPTHEKLKYEVNTLGISKYVLFPGQVIDVENYYADADIYVQSSYREALPLSILEAMASQLPIISTNVGGICDVVTENGILISPGNEEELYRAMKRLLEDVLLRESMGRASLKISVGFSSKIMADRYMQIYEELLKGDGYERSF